MWQAWRVSLEPVPAMTVVPSGRSLAASSMTRRCSSSSSVGASPVVPQTTKPSEPWRARCAMSSTNASSSTSSRSSKGVTMAVMTDPRPDTGAIIPHAVEGAPGRKRRDGRPWLHVPVDSHAARKAPPPVMVDVLGARLAGAGRMPGAAPGSAETAELILFAGERTETGIWEVTPGIFDAVHGPYVEFMHFVAGDATITAAGGEV